MKLCIVYNFAAHYRQSIFKLIDDTFDCTWLFGKANQDIRKMDYSIFKASITEVDTRRFAGLTFQKKVLGLLRKHDIFLMLGDSRCVSTWLFLLFSKFTPRKKVYLWSHGIYGKESKMEMLFKKFIFKLADGVFLYNNYARELMLKKGFKADKLFVIYNSLDYDQQLKIRHRIRPSDIYKEHYENDYPNLIFIGRLTKIKKLEILLEAVSVLKKRGVFFNVTFVGDGSERKTLERKAEELGIDGSIWFYGACYDEMANAELIYNADLCVAPGNVGLTAIHSMVFGTPVMTHNEFKWQMPEFEAIVPSRTGDFFEYGSIISLVEKIEEWFGGNGIFRDQIREECYKEIDDHWTPQYQIEVLKKNILFNE